jgi:hypothetical protein
MSAIVGGRRQCFERSTVAVLATLAAGLLTGSALAAAGSFEVRYVWAGVGAAVPVALALVVVATAWPRQAALGLTGLLVFAGALFVMGTLGRAPDSLPLAVAAVLVAGSVAIAARRARPRDILAGLTLGYASAALIYEISIILHNV